jgi:hypothetical protein
MPRKAKSIEKSIFEIVGGSYAPAPVNFSSYANPATQNTGAQMKNMQPQMSSHYNHQPTTAGFLIPPPLDPFTNFISLVNSNPYIIGVTYLFLNLCGRFLTMELTKQQEQFLAKPFLRPFILFAVMFVGTRNIAIAFWSTIGILSILWFFANENHILCLIPGWRSSDNSESDKSYENNMKAIQGVKPLSAQAAAVQATAASQAAAAGEPAAEGQAPLQAAPLNK